MSMPDTSYIEKFSAHLAEIRSLYNTDEDFTVLWDDYCKSKMAIDKFELKLRKDTHLKHEYEDVVQELENDIIRYLSKGKSSEG